MTAMATKTPRPIRIMVVDDHDLVRRTLCDRLGREIGFEVVAEAATVEEALCYTHTHDPGIVLMDIDLGDMTGLAATLRIAALKPQAGIIFVSAFVNDRYLEFAVRSHTHGYVTKQESLSVLIEAIRAVAAGGRFFSPRVRERLVANDKGAGTSCGLQPRSALLSPRQRQILAHVAQGRSKKEIAGLLYVSIKTVEAHCETLMRRLGLHDRVGLARYAIREEIIRP